MCVCVCVSHQTLNECDDKNGVRNKKQHASIETQKTGLTFHYRSLLLDTLHHKTFHSVNTIDRENLKRDPTHNASFK